MTKFRVVYEGELNCGDVDPELVAKAMLLQDRSALDGYEPSLWEMLDLDLVSVTEVTDEG